MKKKIILIHPKNDVQFIVYPLACLYLSAILLEHNFDPVIFDHNIDDNYEDFLGQHIKDSLFIGISAITGAQVKYGVKIATFVKKNAHRIPIVWGGVFPTSLSELILRDYRVDIAVRGEGEIPCLELATALQRENGIRNINGISYKKNGTIVHNRKQELFDLAKMPPVPWHLINIEKKLSKATMRNLDIETGRGCTYDCTFCSHKISPKIYRGYTPKFILDTIEPLIRKCDYQYVNFFEPHFFSYSKRVEQICNGILSRRLTFKWHGSARANTFIHNDKKFFELLKKSGCNTICFGFESASDKILKRVHKRIIPYQILKSVELCNKYKFTPVASFMIGYHFEDWLDVLKTLVLISKIKKLCPVSNFLVEQYIPFPGTMLYEECRQRYNLKEPSSLEWWGDIKNISKHNSPWLNSITRMSIKIIKCSYYLSDFKYLKLRGSAFYIFILHAIVTIMFKCLSLFYPLLRKKIA